MPELLVVDVARHRIKQLKAELANMLERALSSEAHLTTARTALSACRVNCRMAEFVERVAGAALDATDPKEPTTEGPCTIDAGVKP